MTHAGPELEMKHSEKTERDGLSVYSGTGEASRRVLACEQSLEARADFTNEEGRC